MNLNSSSSESLKKIPKKDREAAKLIGDAISAAIILAHQQYDTELARRKWKRACARAAKVIAESKRRKRQNE